MDRDEPTSTKPWPDVARVGFASGDPFHLNAMVGALQHADRTSMQRYVQGYRAAAILVYDGAADGAQSVDLVFFPLVFLWRHSFELALKEIIGRGRLLSGETWEFPPTHDLERLWQRATPYILALGDPHAPEIANVGLAIQELQEIDPRADGFRYPLTSDRAARTLRSAPSLVNLRTLQDAMLAVSNFFTAVEMALSVRLEAALEQEAACTR